jgi:ElaA protein
MNIIWSLKPFEQLSLQELYSILQLRIEVFIVEQNCPFQDADNKDQKSYHLMGWQENRLCAYTRIVPPGISYEFPSIGRVVTSPAARKGGLGRLLMQQSIIETEKLYGRQSIRIGAQFYLKKFYESLGFAQSSDSYLEDGIEHIEMTRNSRD